MKTALIALALMPLFMSAQAQELSPQSLFNRCYIQLTGLPIPLNHALMNQVKSGQIKALDACLQILNKAKLQANGELNNINDKEAKAVLNTFYSFHRTWFSANSIEELNVYNSFEHNGTVDLYDATEPALALTFSMFGNGQKYSDTLNRPTGVRALRVEDDATKARLGWVSSHPGRFINTFPNLPDQNGNNVGMQNALVSFRDSSTKATAVSRNINIHISQRLPVPIISVGELVGVRPTTEKFTVPNISLMPLGDLKSDRGSLYPELNYSYDFFKTQGGGILGMPIYLMSYYGHGMNMKFNGSTKVPRRWSQQNMESFLCASFPALRESDVRDFVDTNSDVPFRKSSSCVMCHATLDPMAYTARNVTIGATDYMRVYFNGNTSKDADGKTVFPPAAYLRNAIAITTYKTIKESVTGWPSADVPDFHLQKPTGRLYFRSVTGTLIDKSVLNIADLGKAMSETEDYYLCAAKRYFEFMTGIEVPLYDRTDPRNADLNRALSQQSIDDRAYVENLAKNLRNNQSVMQMVEDIIKSPYYSKENFR